MIGGSLAKPVESFPFLFTPGSLWDRFPYLLPNLFSAACVFMGVVVGILFLEETHGEKKHNRDRGIELGAYLLSFVSSSSPASDDGPAKLIDAETRPLLESEENLPGYRTAPNSSRMASPTRDLPSQGDVDTPSPNTEMSPELRQSKPEIFTRPVILNIVSYGILAL
jgi:hypothetical protein